MLSQKIKTTAETLYANFISWPTLSQRNLLCSPEPLLSEYTHLADTVLFSMVGGKGDEDGLQWRMKMVYNDSQGKPLRAAFHRLSRKLHFIQSLTSHIFIQQVRPPWVYVCVPFGLCNAQILHLVGLSPAPARDDHNNLEVWWSLPCLKHPKPSPQSPASFPTCCQRMPWSVASTQHQSHRWHTVFLPRLFALRLESWVSADACVGLALKSTVFPCMFTVLIQRNCSPTAAQTVTLSWMPPVLGQQVTKFRTGHPSFSLLSMFPLKLYSVLFATWSHVYH